MIPQRNFPVYEEIPEPVFQDMKQQAEELVKEENPDNMQW